MSGDSTHGSEAEHPQAGDAEVLAVLIAHRAELASEVAELAEPVRAPGVQVPFGKRAGDHTGDAVLQMTRSVAASELHQLALEIDRAIEKVAQGTYGLCDACGTAIAAARLEALPWAVFCVSCKQSGAKVGGLGQVGQVGRIGR